MSSEGSRARSQRAQAQAGPQQNTEAQAQAAVRLEELGRIADEEAEAVVKAHSEFQQALAAMKEQADLREEDVNNADRLVREMQNHLSMVEEVERRISGEAKEAPTAEPRGAGRQFVIGLPVGGCTAAV